MIKLESLTIDEFRGIRHLAIAPQAKSYVVCGPNGTGKSGIVDAIEFVLTGNISRLTGEGRGEVSVKEHGAHVDSRNNPEKAAVTAVVNIPSLGKLVTIKRSVKHPRQPIITPADEDVVQILKQVEAHPEFALTRREIIKYVLATPGERAEEVQALLHLDQIEAVRANLQKIANATDREAKLLAQASDAARDNLLRALGLGALSKADVLRVANEKRLVLGLAALTDLTDTTSLKDGLVSGVPLQRQRIPKAQALADCAALRAALDGLGAPRTVELRAKAGEGVSALARNTALATNLQRESFYESGLALIDSDKCPFCENVWNLDELREHVRQKRVELEEARRSRVATEALLAPMSTLIRTAIATAETVLSHGRNLAQGPALISLAQWMERARANDRIMLALLPLDATARALESATEVGPEIFAEMVELEGKLNALPDPSRQDAARDWLSIAQERLEVYREARRKQAGSSGRAQRAKTIAEVYAATSDKKLSGIYTTVQNDFAALYSAINVADEGNFQAQLVPSMGKLGFGVDFYGRGFFPPGAYHSEGHQDGMGLCLYLALMRFLQGQNFTFAVLDDVLMSVDVGHRREVCRLLKEKCPDTQFLITTHDRVWLQHMKTEKLIGSKAAIQFRAWDVDQGPAQWEDRDVWEEIEEDLKNNDVRAAAALLRNFLEFTAAELCYRLRGRVELRGDGQYQLGELMPAATSQMKALLKLANKAANSWNQKEVIEALTARMKAFGDAVDASQVEQWQINVAVHYNAWANLSKEEFIPVVKAFRDLLEKYACAECGTLLRVVPEREARDTVRCECGKVGLNLREKA